MTKKKDDKGGGVRKSIFINFVLDETGSMEVCRDATISGFNEYIDSLKKDKKLRFTLTKFDSNKIDVVYNRVLLDKVEHLSRDTYIPGAMTPLYDAIAHTITSIESKVKGKPVLCVIMTDGEENASHEYNRTKLFKLIKDKEKEGWTFVYLGANQDAWAIGQAIGLHRGNVVNYNTAKTGKAFRTLSHNTQCYAASAGAQTANFFEKEDEEQIS